MFGCVAFAPSGSIGNGMRELFRFVPDTRFLILVPKRPEVWCIETILALDVRKIQIVEINVSRLSQQSSIAALSWSGSFSMPSSTCASFTRSPSGPRRVSWSRPAIARLSTCTSRGGRRSRIPRGNARTSCPLDTLRERLQARHVHTRHGDAGHGPKSECWEQAVAQRHTETGQGTFPYRIPMGVFPKLAPTPAVELDPVSRAVAREGRGGCVGKRVLRRC
jgi:hypothetical protein